MFLKKIMPILKLITRYAYLNLLIIIGILLGFLILGITPSLYSAMKVCERWNKESDAPIWATFWNSYRESFLKSQKYTLIFIILILVSFSNWLFWRNVVIPQVTVIEYIWSFITIFVISNSLLILFTIIDNNLSLKEVINLIIFNLSQIHYILLLISGLVIIYIAVLVMPGIFIFFGLSLSVDWIMFNNSFYFKKLLKLSLLK